MAFLIVVNNPHNWRLKIPGVDVVSAKSYLTDSRYSDSAGTKVFNLCRSYRYQSNGYYVSLLAGARGHKAIPNVVTLRDMTSTAVTRLVSEDIQKDIQRNLKGIQSRKFSLSIYFGKNLAKKYDRLALRLFNMFEAPLLRADFSLEKKWQLKHIGPIAASEIPETHHDFVVNRAIDYFSHRRIKRARKGVQKFDLAILHDPWEENPPSDRRAIRHFAKAAEKLGLHAELITRDDFARIAEFDALFVRATTNVNHYTYQFCRRAEAEGLVVIDDPESIIRCSNKVYLAEMLACRHVPTPKTFVVDRERIDAVKKELSFPCIVKLPDSSFSQGVIKVTGEKELEDHAYHFFKRSDLIIIQEFIPTTFDWRIGVLGREPLFACRYFMADNHWQIIKMGPGGRSLAGKVESVPIGEVPPKIIRLALKATAAIGKGLYGVDIKQHEEKCYVMEVNDNPNIDVGYEDTILKGELYNKIMKVFLKRIQERR